MRSVVRKMKDKLIHLLGGVTVEESQAAVVSAFNSVRMDLCPVFRRQVHRISQKPLLKAEFETRNK